MDADMRRHDREPADAPWTVALGAVGNGDVEVFFEQQLDLDAVRMAAVRSRDRAAHEAHWDAILRDADVVCRTVLVDGRVAGHVVSWNKDGRRAVGYWLGRDYWGRGVATSALRQFLGQLTSRPLFAYVAAHNVASQRVLEKCGFRFAARYGPGDDGIEELVMELTS